jgi:hypothetical protein
MLADLSVVQAVAVLSLPLWLIAEAVLSHPGARPADRPPRPMRRRWGLASTRGVLAAGLP